MLEQKARNFARRKHGGQLDDSGKSYLKEKGLLEEVTKE